ncbi:hypothetical protein F5146DRAFT_1138781 [Armillaria mellea]|nr:hypothetical protein F5146DRAFT_1138781 [Armillaria mellea]
MVGDDWYWYYNVISQALDIDASLSIWGARRNDIGNNLTFAQFIDNHSVYTKAEFLPGHYAGKFKGCVSIEEDQHHLERPISDDYTTRYPKDPIGDEMSANGRFWHTYTDEALIFDGEMVDVYHDTINVLLVFAGLFSAVLTTFVIQASQNLRPDYTEVSASLLMELVGFQRAANLSSNPSSPLCPSIPFSPSSADVWLNSLWFVSLTLSLITALVAVLVKQWLHQYISVISDILPRDRGYIRQYRYMGLMKWQVPMIIGLLPVLLHISLGLFFAGLSIYLYALDIVIACVVVAISATAYVAYVACPHPSPSSITIAHTKRR